MKITPYIKRKKEGRKFVYYVYIIHNDNILKSYTCRKNKTRKSYS